MAGASGLLGFGNQCPGEHEQWVFTGCSRPANARSSIIDVGGGFEPEVPAAAQQHPITLPRSASVHQFALEGLRKNTIVQRTMRKQLPKLHRIPLPREGLIVSSKRLPYSACE